MNELKKHTVSTVMPVKFSIEMLSKLNTNISNTVHSMKNENKEMTNKVDSLLSDNEYLKECLDKIVSKLNA